MFLVWNELDRVAVGVGVSREGIELVHMDGCLGCRLGIKYVEQFRYLNPVTDAARAMLAIAKASAK